MNPHIHPPRAPPGTRAQSCQLGQLGFGPPEQAPDATRAMPAHQQAPPSRRGRRRGAAVAARARRRLAGVDRPYTLLSCAMSLDGYIDDVSGTPLRLSSDADLRSEE